MNAMGDMPDWHRPPQMVGGHAGGPVLIRRSDEVVVVIRQVLAYPVGVEMEIEAHVHGGSLGIPDDPMRLGGHMPLRFGVRFADGRTAVQDDEAGLRSGLGPMVVVNRWEAGSGGPDNREDIRLSLWIWPLPPPGPFTVTCSWPDRGLRDVDLGLDGDAIRAAADQAQPFWPDPS